MTARQERVGAQGAVVSWSVVYPTLRWELSVCLASSEGAER